MCHLELDPFGLGWRRAVCSAQGPDSSLAVAKWTGGGGQISVITHWPRQDAASQAELPLCLEDQLDNKVLCAHEQQECISFKVQHQRCIRFIFSFYGGVFVPVKATQSITQAQLLDFKKSIFWLSLIYTVNLTGDLWHQHRKRHLPAQKVYLKETFNILRDTPVCFVADRSEHWL